MNARRPLALVFALGAGIALAAPPRAARSQTPPAPSPPAAPPSSPPASPDDSDVVEVGGAVRSLPRAVFVPADQASVAATRELARLVSLTGLYATQALAPGAAAGGLVVRVTASSDSSGQRLEALTQPQQGGTKRRAVVVPPSDPHASSLEQARLADAVVADLSGQRSHLSGSLLYVDASRPGERQIRLMLASGAPLRDISPAGLLARGADRHPGGTVYYAAGRPGEKLDLHAEGKEEPVELKVPGFVQSVAFAPDGRAALVVGEREGGVLYQGLLEGRMERVDTGANIALAPSFGPSGELAYAAGPPQGPLRVFVAGKPVSPPGAWASAPSFCPRQSQSGVEAKSRLAYMLKQGESWTSVIVDLTSGLSQAVGPGVFPACSPDGRTVAVGRAKRGKAPGGVFLSGEDGIAWHRVRDGEIAGLRWAPGPPLPPEG